MWPLHRARIRHNVLPVSVALGPRQSTQQVRAARLSSSDRALIWYMTDWSRLEHAYGPAGDLPELFAATTGPHERQAWDRLWASLCHQGSLYSASLAALPYLAELAAARPPSFRDQPLLLAGAILDEFRSDDPTRKTYAQTISLLAQLTNERLESPAPRIEQQDFVWLLAALLTFERGGEWSGFVSCLGEYGSHFFAPCPGCGKRLFIAIDPNVTPTGPALDHINRVGVLADPVVVQPLDDLGTRLRRLAIKARQMDVAARVSYLFGESGCPVCGARFRVPDTVS